MKRLEKAAEAIAKSILRNDSMRVISHNDADGIASAGLICNALYRAGIPFHASLLNRLDASAVEGLHGPVVFCDMGSSKPDLISRVKDECFVLDHHKPVGSIVCHHLNPHDFGIDGAFELSAAGTVYSVVRKMGNNLDLAGLALAGALGDRQAMVGPNRAILEEAISARAVEVRPGLKMSEDGPVEQVFEHAVEPLLDFTGDPDGIRALLEELRISGDMRSLSGAELERLATALTLRLLMQGSNAADSVLGEVIRLKREVVENSLELVQLLNACGNRDLPGLGLSICLRDRDALPEARRLAADYKGHIKRELRVLQEQKKEMKNIRYLSMENMEAGAVVAGLGIRYLLTDKPLLTLNRKDQVVKVSARGNRLLVDQGLDLSLALSRAAETVGGAGGGHNVASGASIPPGSEDRFLAMVDEIVGTQLKRQGSAA